jgi:hypothetical protein
MPRLQRHWAKAKQRVTVTSVTGGKIEGIEQHHQAKNREAK